MSALDFERLVRALADGAGTRRALARGLAGLTAISAMELLGLDEAEAKRKRKKKRNRRRHDSRDDVLPVGDPPAGDNPPPPPPPPPASPPPPPPPPPPPVCDGTICEEQCVDLDTDQNNCGACGNVCDELFFCCGGACRARLNDDNLNCGSCGRTCTGGDRCCFGRCIGQFEICG